MTLPEIVLPKIALPFDIPVLLHPIVDHFMIALPVVVLLLEFMNLMMKKKAVGGVSFFLLILTVAAAIGAYLTGLTDGKEAYDALSQAAKADLSEHKLLGTYLMLGSAVLLTLKILAMTGNKILRGLYLLVLIVFVVLLFKQGEEGGELVYEHGVNVEAVKTLDDKVFDLEEALDEAKEAQEKILEKSAPKEEAVSQKAEVPQVPASQPAEPVTPVTVKKPTVMETTGVESVEAPAAETAPLQETQTTTDEVVVIPSEPAVSE